jgi:hypothetical protein
MHKLVGRDAGNVELPCNLLIHIATLTYLKAEDNY